MDAEEGRGHKVSRQQRRRSERLAKKANEREEKSQLMMIESAVEQRREDEKRNKKKAKDAASTDDVYVQHFRPEDVKEIEPGHPMMFTGRMPDESEMTKIQRDKMMAAERFQSSMREQKGDDMDTAKKFFDDVANSNLARYRDVVKEAQREWEMETMELMRNEEEKLRKVDEGNAMSISNLISDNDDSI